jgi:phosphonate transport system ATP-binding protein
MMIKIKGLHKEYGKGTKALTNVNLEIPQGQFTVLLGPSGAGKSTLLRSINGLVKPTSGEIFVQGEPVHDLRKLENIRRKVGMIFQQFNLVKRLTVIENVLCGRLAHTNVWASCLKLFSGQDIDLALHCLERVGLEHKAYQRADQLSGGQQQRVGIARALAQCPAIILADEPVASLDPKSAEKVMAALQSIKEQDQITIIVSLHSIELATRYAERIIGIKDGIVVIDKLANMLTTSDIEHIYGTTADLMEEEFDCSQVAYVHA